MIFDRFVYKRKNIVKRFFNRIQIVKSNTKKEMSFRPQSLYDLEVCLLEQEQKSIHWMFDHVAREIYQEEFRSYKDISVKLKNALVVVVSGFVDDEKFSAIKAHLLEKSDCIVVALGDEAWSKGIFKNRDDLRGLCELESDCVYIPGRYPSPSLILEAIKNKDRNDGELQ